MYRREAANDRERVRMNLMTDAFIRCVYMVYGADPST
jgi:hypothetical protein